MNCLTCGQPFPDYLAQLSKALDDECVHAFIVHSHHHMLYINSAARADEAIDRIPDLQMSVRQEDDDVIQYACDILACPECEEYGCRCRERISPEGFAEIVR